MAMVVMVATVATTEVTTAAATLAAATAVAATAAGVAPGARVLATTAAPARQVRPRRHRQMDSAETPSRPALI